MGTFINNLRASLKKTDTETDTQKKVIQAEVDSFGKKERKQRNTIESNLLKVEEAYSDNESISPEAETAINLLKKKKQNEKYRFFNEIWMINRIQRRRQRLSWISTKNLRYYRTQIQTRGM